MKDETKATKILEKAAATEDNGDGDKPSANSIVERADAAAERLAKENERTEANIRRQEELMAKQALGGRSEVAKQEKPKDLTDAEFSKKFLKGEIPSPF